MNDMGLTVIEQTELATLEITISNGLQTFVEVGTALMRIRDNNLYRGQYARFEDYCRERWGMERAHAYRLIDSAKVITNLSPIGDILPSTESQARPLTRLDPDLQPIAWQQAVDTAGQARQLRAVWGVSLCYAPVTRNKTTSNKRRTTGNNGKPQASKLIASAQ